MSNVRVMVALGSFAWDGCLRALHAHHYSARPKPDFGHGAEARLGPYVLLGSYHPSQQNTFTGKLTRPLFEAVFQRARSLLATPVVPEPA